MRWYEVTGKTPIAVRWIDINKGDSALPNYRSRLVAKEFNDSKKPNLFAATPPVEGLKMLLSKLASGKGKMRLICADVSRAYFYARATRPVYAKLVPEDYVLGMCGRLSHAMHGSRYAASCWEQTYRANLETTGFKTRASTP